MKGIPPAGTALLSGGVLDRTWYDYFLSLKGDFVALSPYKVSTLPNPVKDGLMAFCTDESGGAVPVFSDNGVWRRVTDRAVVT